MPKVLETSAAQREVIRIAQFIAADRPRIALKFLRAVRQTFRLIGKMPILGGLVEELQGSSFGEVRRFAVQQFKNYLILYKSVPEGVLIIHVLDGRQDYLRSLFGVHSN